MRKYLERLDAAYNNYEKMLNCIDGQHLVVDYLMEVRVAIEMLTREVDNKLHLLSNVDTSVSDSNNHITTANKLAEK